MRLPKLSLLIAIALLAAGCAGLEPQFTKPTMTLSSIKLAPSTSLSQQFILGFRVSNPNKSELNIDGLVYKLSLLGQPVVSGVGTNFPAIPAYGEGDIELTASVSLLSGWQVVRKILAAPNQPIEYKLQAELDIPWWMTPIDISESGEIVLGSP